MKKIVFGILSAIVIAALLVLFFLVNTPESNRRELGETDAVAIDSRSTERGADQTGRAKTISEAAIDFSASDREADGMIGVADLNISLLFDESVPKELQYEIELDLESAFVSKQSYKIFENVKDTDGKTKTMIEFYGGAPLPDLLSNGLYEVHRSGSGSVGLEINDQIIEAYEEAIRLRERHELAFNQLLELRERINRTRPSEVTIANSRKIMHFATDGELSDEVHQEAVASSVSATFGMPSILELKERDPSQFGIKSRALPEGKSLSAVIYAKVPNEESFFPFLFFWNGSNWVAGLADQGA